MTIFDYVVIVVMVLSVALGWWRGFVYELLSLLGWVAAFFVARLFAPDVVRLLPDVITAEILRAALAYIVLFIGSLIVSALLAWLLSKFIKLAGLGIMDGVMGAVFGVVRGFMLVLLAMLLAGATTLPQETFWKEAWSSPALQNVALFTRDFLPEDLARKVNY